MGYIKHNAIVCTTWKEEDAIEAQQKAKEIFEAKRKGSSQLVSELVEYIVNGGYSFFIAPDGSKEGWEDSNQCDDARKDFLDWLRESDNYCDYVEIRFGGDDEHEDIVRSKGINEALSKCVLHNVSKRFYCIDENDNRIK